MLSEDEKDALFEAICDGDRETVVELVTRARDGGDDLGAVLRDAMIPAMAEVGEQFSAGEIFVPEMLVAARAMQGGIDIIEPVLAATDHEPLARVCIGSVKGDLHDIGKNLVAMMLEGAGFEVIDLGPDVPAEKFIAAINEHKPGLVGLSALLTTTAPMMRMIVNAFQAAGVRDEVKVLVGGAAVSQEFADEIGADGYAPDAGAAVRKAKELLAVAA